jgi:pimeloyl-ACP methyl ester carboxylesterase
MPRPPSIYTAVVKVFPLRAICCTVLVCGPAAGARVDHARSLHMVACRFAELARPARCGVLDVAENPAKPEGRRLTISVVVVPARATPALPDPIVVLMGGPGEDAISSAGLYAGRFASLLENRDLLLVDQRGTGRSGALPCALYSSRDPSQNLRDMFPVAAVKACAQRLSQHADLTQYLYTRSADDLEQVRLGLGFGKLNLYAGSYGTRAAQVYMRAYPESVRTAYLGSAVPLDAANPLPFARTAQAALDNLFSACSADAACRKAFPKLAEEFRDVLARLDSGSVQVAVPDTAAKAPLARGRVAEWFRSKLYRPKSASNLPWLIHRAHQGDWDSIAKELLSDARDADSGLSFGLFLSITCNEDVAFVLEQNVPAATEGTFLGDYRLRQQQAACLEWPKASLPRDYRQPVRSDVPTLLVSGDADGATPLWYADHVAAGLPNHVQVVAVGQGHTEWSDCISRLHEGLVRSGSVSGLNPSCPAEPRPAFKIS